MSLLRASLSVLPLLLLVLVGDVQSSYRSYPTPQNVRTLSIGCWIPLSTICQVVRNVRWLWSFLTPTLPRDRGVAALDGRWFPWQVRWLVGYFRAVGRRSFAGCLRLSFLGWTDLEFILQVPVDSFSKGQVLQVGGMGLLAGAILVCPFNVHFTSPQFRVCPLLVDF
jgi:hypothetical protein